MLKYLLSLSILLGVSGCLLVGPDFVRPKVDIDKKFSLESSEKISLNEPNFIWWQNFSDPLLVRLVNQAVKGNRDVKASVGRLQIARGIARQSLSDLLPAPNASSNYIKNRTPSVRFPGFNSDGIAFELYSIGGDISWELDLLGRLRRAREGSLAEYESSLNLLEDTSRIVVADVVENYLRLRGLQRQLKVAEELASTYEETVDIVSAQKSVGVATALELERAKADYSSAQANIPTIQSEIERTIHRVSVLTGKPPRYYFKKLSPIIEIPDYKGAIRIGSPAKLIRRRPDLRSLEYRVKAANSRIGVALGEYFPKVFFNGSFTLDAAKPYQWDNSGAKNYNYGPSISWSGFNFTAVDALVKQAKGDHLQALAAYEQGVLVALEEVENSLVNWRETSKSMFRFAAAVKASRKAYSLGKDQYQTGSIDLANLLLIQQNLLRDETNLANQKTNLAVSYVQIYRALAGGWEEADLE
jgi:outer membrane protein, multidrug efflux system